ncbi:amidase [Halorussus halobius]|uniref:amidase n=1 Tax=Halorussus halobius TaxID=1710537 RepID=UPI001092ADF9|nr:amidase family protein [Halorussus halobius]
MSRDSITPEQVRETADRLGVPLSDEAVADLVAGEDDPPTGDAPEPAETASNVTRADDQLNALAYRFDLPAGDGPLSSLSVGVKDNLAVAGVPATCGSAAAEFTGHDSATVVRRLAEAGADVTATTNMDEFALYTTGETCGHGRTANPRVEGCVPGGSSSGSGAAVADGLLDAALGSDTGGSVRIPASYCGVVGLKPTYGRVSRYGFADLAPSFDVVGPLARDVETVARVFDAISGPDPSDPTTYGAGAPEPASAGLDRDGSDLRLGLVEQAVERSRPRVADRVEAVAEAVAADAATVESVSLPGFEDAIAAHVAITGAEFAALLSDGGRAAGPETGFPAAWRETASRLARSPELGERVRKQFVRNRALDEAARDARDDAASATRAAFAGAVRDRLAEFDALVLPTTPTTAPEFGAVSTAADVTETTANTAPFNVSGNPALSVPAGTVDGKPVGLQVVSAWNDEATAIAVGEAVANAGTP